MEILVRIRFSGVKKVQVLNLKDTDPFPLSEFYRKEESSKETNEMKSREKIKEG